jgi:hypothetical protein
MDNEETKEKSVYTDGGSLSDCTGGGAASWECCLTMADWIMKPVVYQVDPWNCSSVFVLKSIYGKPETGYEPMGVSDW